MDPAGRPTLLHGDVRPGNVLVDAGRATLIDWGSARIGPAALDLANLVTAGSVSVARYTRTWQQLTGQPPRASSPGFVVLVALLLAYYLTAAHRAAR